MKRLIQLLTVILVSMNSLHAENWPQFRGPTHPGRSAETGLPLNWSATNNVLWITPIPGESWSSPIVWNDRVFLTTATDSGQTCRVLSLDVNSGKILWDQVVFQQSPRRKESRNTYATPTPATDGERVYACFGDGSFAALNFAGDIVWTNRDYNFYGQHGLASSPILYRGQLIMARDGSSDGADKKLGWQVPWDQSRVLALDARTGKKRWQGKRGLSRIAHGVPAIWEHDGKAEVVSEAGDVVQGFDAQTGERLWSDEVIGEGKVPSTVLGDGLVFTAGGWSGRDSIKAFRLGGQGDLKETQLVWEQKKNMPRVPSLLYLKPYLFAITDGGVASCMKADTGELIWQERVGGNFSASPLVAEGRIYFLGDDGETTVIEAGPEFKVLAKNALGEKCQASPAISQKRIFIRTAGNLFCLAVAAERAGALPAGGLIGSWSFNETSGEQVVDGSGAGHHGQLRGAVRRAIENFGKVIDCHRDALVEIPHAALFDQLPVGLTVAAWVNRRADAKWNTVISREVKDGTSEYFGLAVVGNKALFSVDPDGAHYQNTKSEENVPVGEWVHLAGTYDNLEFKLYVNGRLAGASACTGPFRFQDRNPILIGGNSNNEGRSWVDCFHGLIDEVRLFDRALTAKEVAELGSQTPAGISTTNRL